MSGDGDHRPPFRVSHVVFDIDGTLIDFVGGYEAGMAAAAARASAVTGATVTPAMLRAEQRSAAAILRAAGMPPGEARIEGFRRALAALGCDGADVDAAIGAFDAARDARLEPYDDVEPTLAALAGRGFVLLAASNGNAEMARHEVFQHFTATWFAEVAGVAKPDLRFFLGALEHVGVLPEAALMVGDRLDNDYEPARAIGMQAVLIDREGRVEDASVARVDALTELLELVERI